MDVLQSGYKNLPLQLEYKRFDPLEAVGSRHWQMESLRILCSTTALRVYYEAFCSRWKREVSVGTITSNPENSVYTKCTRWPGRNTRAIALKARTANPRDPFRYRRR